MAFSHETKANALKSALSTVKSLKTATKDLTIAELQDIITKVNQVIEERKQEIADRENRLKAYEEALKQIDAIRESSGISEEDFLAHYTKNTAPSEKKERKPRKPVVPKYRYTTLAGEEKLWTGQGKTPLPLKERMDADGITDKEHYRMSDDEIAAIEQQMNAQ
ncbi:H-NS family nucleoid-associated regulatory protein [Succinimonas amylolytica]|uniref:H-NS family histone-like protein n=1 Tax=Succinimonas amylolytica TaxID=83769 RepID=UPI00037B674B|nr:H-NS family nucleoid-associated regulatory protein [Succinimonas amylolytica]